MKRIIITLLVVLLIISGCFKKVEKPEKEPEEMKTEEKSEEPQPKEQEKIQLKATKELENKKKELEIKHEKGKSEDKEKIEDQLKMVQEEIGSSDKIIRKTAPTTQKPTLESGSKLDSSSVPKHDQPPDSNSQLKPQPERPITPAAGLEPAPDIPQPTPPLEPQPQPEPIFTPYYSANIGSHGLFDSESKAWAEGERIENAWFNGEIEINFSGWETYPVRHYYAHNESKRYYTLNFY